MSSNINDNIYAVLKDNQQLCKRFKLAPIIDQLPEFLSNPRADTAISISRIILQRHGKDILADYMSRLADIEIAVQKFNPNLRDHVNHSAYVFFLGLFFDSKFPLLKIRRPLSWKLAAFLHDIGYPLELFSRSMSEYLGDVHSLRKDITGEGQLGLQLPNISMNIRNFEKLVSGWNAFDLINRRLADWGFHTDVRKVYEEKMNRGVVDHGILSSLVVLNIIDALYHKYNPHNIYGRVIKEGLDWSMRYYMHEILDAVSAIAAHNLTLEELGSQISLEKARMLYLLCLCDSLQIWNRKSLKLFIYQPSSIDVSFHEGLIVCTLDVSDRDFLKVQGEINKLKSRGVVLDLKNLKD